MASSTKNIADLAYLMPSSPEKLKQPLVVHDTPELKAKADKDTWKAQVERKRKIELISSEDVSVERICKHQLNEDKSDFQCSSVSAEEMQYYKANVVRSSQSFKGGCRHSNCQQHLHHTQRSATSKEAQGTLSAPKGKTKVDLCLLLQCR